MKRKELASQAHDYQYFELSLTPWRKVPWLLASISLLQHIIFHRLGDFEQHKCKEIMSSAAIN